ncbi:hypothetical protein WMF30_53170 [Sorangium sp. So ce134]
MCATAANLIEDVLPEVAHRPWGLTFPFPWRRRLAQDGALRSGFFYLRAEAPRPAAIELLPRCATSHLPRGPQGRRLMTYKFLTQAVRW